MLFFLQKPPTNTQNVYMKYISYLKILNIAVHNYYTECCFLWDAEALYVLFLCKEKKRTDSEKLVQDKDRIRLKRKDCVEIALQSGIFGHRDFSVFTVEYGSSKSCYTKRDDLPGR